MMVNILDITWPRCELLLYHWMCVDCLVLGCADLTFFEDYNYDRLDYWYVDFYYLIVWSSTGKMNMPDCFSWNTLLCRYLCVLLQVHPLQIIEFGALFVQKCFHKK